MKKLFVKNPNLEEKKFTILGIGKESKLLFSVMLQNDMYVEAFISIDGTDTDLKLMNKPVIALDEYIENKKNATIVATGMQYYDSASKLQDIGYDVYYDYNYTSYVGDSVLLDGDNNL